MAQFEFHKSFKIKSEFFNFFNYGTRTIHIYQAIAQEF